MRTVASLAVLLTAAAASAQQVTVQQPSFGVTSAATTIAVPDRGEAFLGGVGRSAAARSSFGPFGRGGIGRASSAGGMSARVTIHDFEAMDAALLAAPADGVDRPAYSKGRYDDPTGYAMSRREAALARRPAVPAEPTVERQDDPARRLASGEAAEAGGRTGVAAVYYRLAAKQGSEEAARRLAALRHGSAVATAAE